MSEARVDDRVEHRYADLRDVRLHYVEAGEGPLVLLLHGFPDFWYSWRKQIPALVDAGFRVVAPDMRGYNLSDKPRGVRAYRIDVLVRDVERLIQHLGEKDAFVVGHDWGGVVAWHFAMRHPDMVERLAILNAPHPVGFLKELRHPRQLAKSWYIFFFQIPRLPEVVLRRRDHAALRALYKTDASSRDAFTDEDVERYIEAASRPGALTNPINYYRAAAWANPVLGPSQFEVVDKPVLVIWGEKDRALSSKLADPDRRWVLNARVERVPHASHWVHMDEPERVNSVLIDFLSDDSA